MIAPPRVESVGRLLVVRDDLLDGGTKERIAGGMIEGASGAVYGSPAEGYAQVALAIACRRAGIPCVIVTAARRTPHASTRRAEAFGARIIGVRPGYLAVVNARAREEAARLGYRLVPFGFAGPAAIDALASAAAPVASAFDPPEVWVASGSGTLALALSRAFPRAVVHAVRVGRALSAAITQNGRIVVHEAPEPFSRRAEIPPPFPSAPTFDAKVWRFASAGAQDGALVWNVAA